MPPQLLKRLAEAALGPHGPGEQFWVCRFEPDERTHKYDLEGPFPTRELADAKLAKVTEATGGRFGVFGPYRRTIRDSVRVAMQNAVAEILEITVRVRIDQAVKVVDIPPKEFDALFWGSPAVEKFVLPYYAGASGLDYAIKVRDDYRNGKAYLLAHSGDTEEKVFTPDERETENTVSLTPLLLVF
jgi:hypothetical protein